MERLPKGFGGVIKMSGKKRLKPYMVRIQVGMKINKVKGTAYPDYRIIGYAKSKKEGILMLQKYHDNPYDLENTLTFEEVYEKTMEEFVNHRSRSSILAYQASFKACEKIHRMSFKDIRVKDLQKIIDTCGKNYPTLRKIKVLFNQMYKYAMKYDIVTKDYSEYVDISKYNNKNPNKKERNAIDKKTINILWALSEDRYYQIILMLIYTGVRISEFLELKKKNVNLEERYFDILRSKTENGIRRVPIAACVYPFFENWYQYSQADTLLCTKDHKPFKYRNYYDSYWEPLFEQKNLSNEYTPHCTRHTCISLLAEAKVEPTTIKKIVGHRGAMSLTEKVYTHLDISILIEAVNKMYVPKGY